MKSRLILSALVFFSLGWAAHAIFNADTYSSLKRSAQVRENSPAYKYINPLLYIDNSQLEFEELSPLKGEVEKYLHEAISEGKLATASFYFRDLDSGAWTGVRPDDKFIPGSMLKVAVLITYLRLTEDNPELVNQSIYYKKNPAERQNYPPESELADGYYPSSRLLGQTIIESDNAAAAALSLPHEREISGFYAALRLPEVPEKLTDFMSPRDISRIFRSLYSSTYLLNSYSEQALELLTKTKFRKGLVAGVSDDIEVAHKFGEHTTYYTDGRSPDYQLHDCGIVYYPEKPYFICVMTKGKVLENMETAIAEVSRITESFVEGK